jgi:hypothetical protein
MGSVRKSVNWLRRVPLQECTVICPLPDFPTVQLITVEFSGILKKAFSGIFRQGILKEKLGL